MNNAHRFCIAPMLHCTDRHYRYLARLLTRCSMLYTEMITTGALIHGNREQLLKFNPCEHPVALQLGGSNAFDMARCATYAAEYGYDEININVGCPSGKVQAGKFGACLMLEPDTVARCIKAMRSTADINVTVKTRIGVDDRDGYENLYDFVGTVSAAGCTTIIVHARKAFLSGLNPRENRTIPPLHYDYVYRLKHDYPHLNVILNGGINDKNKIKEHLKCVDGVMVGREAYANPFFLADIDALVFDESASMVSRHEILEKYKLYIQAQLQKGVPLQLLARHISGLFKQMPGAKIWRRYLSEHVHKESADIGVINQAENFIVSMSEAVPAN